MENQVTNDPLEGYDFWGEHPDFPIENWQHEVWNGDTRQGYWAWVKGKLEEAANDTPTPCAPEPALDNLGETLAYMQGYRAYTAGILGVNNPYAIGTEERQEWLDGWQDAQSDAIDDEAWFEEDAQLEDLALTLDWDVIEPIDPEA